MAPVFRYRVLWVCAMIAGGEPDVGLSGGLLDASEYGVVNGLARELERMRVFEFEFKYNSAPRE